jgi:hypothetical protein
MKILDRTSEELFNKIRGKFSQVTIGDENGEVTNEQTQARYFNFKFKSQGKTLGDVNIALEEENGLTIIYSKDFIKNQNDLIKNEWYSFLKDMRKFAKKRLLQFDVRDITKSNLSKKDFEWLSKQQKSKSGDDSKMNESKMYGTNKTSYQRIGNARLSIKHSAPINVENSAGRTQKISNIFIESPEGEKFRYPYRHLSGARAMARHVSEGGTAYDDFGKYISSLSEELSKLRKFNTYMGRTGVMAETLGEYTDIVKERAGVIRKEIQNLQKENYYKEKIEGFSAPIVEEVPADVTENWIDQLTIRQFNEELKDVFPYIYRLVGEAKRVEDIGPKDLEEKSDPCWDNYEMVGTKEKNGKTVPNCVPKKESNQNHFTEKSENNFTADDLLQLQKIDNIEEVKRRALELISTNSRRPMRPEKINWFKTAIDSKQNREDVIKLMYDLLLSGDGHAVVGSRGSMSKNSYRKTFEESQIEEYFENLMGNFSDKKTNENDENPRMNHIWVKFQYKLTAQTKERYLVAYAGFGNSPDDVKFDEALRKYFHLKTVSDIEKALTELKNDNTFLNVKKILIYDQNPNDPLLNRFFEWFGKNYAGDIFEIVSKPAANPMSREVKDNIVSVEIWIPKLEKKVKIGPGSFVVARKVDKNLTDFKRSSTVLKTGDMVQITDGQYAGYTGAVQQIYRKQDTEKEKGSADKKPYANIKPRDIKEPVKNKLITFRMSPKFYGTAIGHELTDPGKKGTSDKKDKYGLAWVREYRRAQTGSFVMPEAKFELFKKQAEALNIPFKKRGSNKIVKLDPQIEIINVAESQSDQNQKKSKTPLGEFILSYFDRYTARFPKGEQAVLTAVEKDYGDRYVEPARQFIEQVTATTLEYLQQTVNQPRLPET